MKTYTDKQFKYLKIINQQLNSGKITKKEFKQELKFIKKLATK